MKKFKKRLRKNTFKKLKRLRKYVRKPRKNTLRKKVKKILNSNLETKWDFH